MKSQATYEPKAGAMFPADRHAHHCSLRVRTDRMMKCVTHRLLLAGFVCLALGSFCNRSSAQTFSGPVEPYAGGLPWDQRQQYYEQLPSDRGRGYDGQSPLDRLLHQAIDQSWISVDYLHWNLDDVDDDLIGAPVLNVDRPDLGYTINDTTTGAPSTNVDDVEQINYTPRLGELNLNDRSGMELTYGLDTNYGTFEANVMWIFQATRSMDPGPPFPYQSDVTYRDPFAGVIALPFSVNGAEAIQAIVVDRMAIEYDTSIVGTEFNFISEDYRPLNGFHFRPILGVRYLRVNETLNLNGTVFATDDSPQQSTFFASETINQIFGPTIGAEIELSDEVFTLGARPGFTFGFNHMNSKVTGRNPQSPFDETVVIENDNSNDQFAPILSLSLYTKIRLFENVKLIGSYDILFLDTVSRAYETIEYDTVSTSPGFYANTKHTSMLNQGFSVGLLFEF